MAKPKVEIWWSVLLYYKENCVLDGINTQNLTNAFDI